MVWIPCRSHILEFEVLRNRNIILKRDPGHVDYKSKLRMEDILATAGFQIEQSPTTPSRICRSFRIIEEALLRWLPLSPWTSTGRLAMSMTSVFGRRHPPIACSRHPASRCNPSRSTSTPSFADHAATRRDSVGCDGRRPPLAQRHRARPVAGGQPQCRIVAQFRWRRCGPSGPAPPAAERPRPPPLRMAGSGARPACPATSFARNRTTLLAGSNSLIERLRILLEPETSVANHTGLL